MIIQLLSLAMVVLAVFGMAIYFGLKQRATGIEGVSRMSPSDIITSVEAYTEQLDNLIYGELHDFNMRVTGYIVKDSSGKVRGTIKRRFGSIDFELDDKKFEARGSGKFEFFPQVFFKEVGSNELICSYQKRWLTTSFNGPSFEAITGRIKPAFSKPKSILLRQGEEIGSCHRIGVSQYLGKAIFLPDDIPLEVRVFILYQQFP